MSDVRCESYCLCTIISPHTRESKVNRVPASEEPAQSSISSWREMGLLIRSRIYRHGLPHISWGCQLRTHFLPARVEKIPLRSSDDGRREDVTEGEIASEMGFSRFFAPLPFPPHSIYLLLEQIRSNFPYIGATSTSRPRDSHIPHIPGKNLRGFGLRMEKAREIRNGPLLIRLHISLSFLLKSAPFFFFKFHLLACFVIRLWPFFITLSFGPLA